MTWYDDAVCAKPNAPEHEAWFIGSRPGGTSPGIERATYRAVLAELRAVCATCPVQPECLTDALTERDQYGVRAGLAEDERRALARRARRAKGGT